MSISYIPEIKSYKEITPFRRFVLQSFPWINETFDALTNCELMGKIIEYLNDVIKNEKITEENVTSLYNGYLQLQNYLNTLDLQDEVNNKLDDMAESGQLQEIIASYLNANALWCFDTIQDMKNATNLINGSFAKTFGFYEKNDMGGASYKIRNVTNDDVIDEMFIIALNDENNELVGELIIENEMNLKQFGIKENDTDDESEKLQAVIDNAVLKNYSIVGNNSSIKITKTISVPAYTNIKNCKFKMYSGSYAKNFMMFFNNDSTYNNWKVAFPKNSGMIENCEFTNATENSEYSAIYNYSNGSFKDLSFNNFDISFYNSTLYLDSYSIERLTVNSKIGTNYAFSCGYLGDQVNINTIHLLTSGANAMNIGAGHNGIIIKNLICHGNLNIEGSNVTIENLHFESKIAKILINNSICKISNGFIYHNTNANDHNIEVSNNSNVTIENVKFNYDLRTSDNSTDDIDINIASNSIVRVINSFKRLLVSDIAENNLCVAKTNIAQSGNLDQVYNNLASSRITYGTNQVDWVHGAYASALSGQDRGKWQKPTGTYYYAFKPFADFTRKIAYPQTTQKYSKDLTNGESAYMVSLNSGKYRVYRGTSANSYNEYMDIELVSGYFIDNGIIANGYTWKTRTAADVDTTTNLSSIGTVYMGSNILFYTGATPSYGEWLKGDLIVSPTGSAWACQASGTPRNLECFIIKKKEAFKPLFCFT